VLIFFAAGLEAAGGLLLLVSPSLVASSLFGAELPEPGQALGRLAGITLLALAAACWPGWPGPAAPKHSLGALRGLLTYNLLATAYFLYIGLDGRWAGVLVWPAFALHAVVTALILRAWLAARSDRRSAER
jgi:hypothetical protein